MFFRKRFVKFAISFMQNYFICTKKGFKIESCCFPFYFTDGDLASLINRTVTVHRNHIRISVLCTQNN